MSSPITQPSLTMSHVHQYTQPDTNYSITNDEWCSYPLQRSSITDISPRNTAKPRVNHKRTRVYVVPDILSYITQDERRWTSSVMTFSNVQSREGSRGILFNTPWQIDCLIRNVIAMQISRNTSIACVVLLLYVLIGHMVQEGDSVIVVMSKGLVRKPQAANGNKQTTSVVINAKIRRNSNGVATKTKQKWIKSWISRVLRSKDLAGLYVHIPLIFQHTNIRVQTLKVCNIHSGISC